MQSHPILVGRPIFKEPQWPSFSKSVDTRGGQIGVSAGRG
jgi:hypothetical protein